MPDVLLFDLLRLQFALWSKLRTVRDEPAQDAAALPTS